MRPISKKEILFTLIILIAFHFTGTGQLNARFTMDQSGGCAPLTVFFTNTTSASSSAVYEWDFGNGNTSSLKDPGSVFLDQKEYTVKLTVKDGDQASSYSEVVTVYKNPVVGFSVSSSKVCTPDPVTFTGNATADKGNIVDYMWDFGDGFTERSYGPQMAHTYLSKQNPSVTLSVTDNHGCTNSKTINNILEVIPGITASFDADKTFICFETDPVKLINSSSGEGLLNYSWDFGDGITSSEKDPTHSFNKKGIYSVKLSVESSTGCKGSLVKTSYLNVGEFKSQMSVQDAVCQNSELALKNSSTPTPTSYSWVIDGVPYSHYYSSYSFYTVGEHTIQLVNKFGACEETITKKIKVNELPQPKGFITEIPEYCFPPVTVTFKDTTAGAVKSEWNFNYYGSPIITGKTAYYNFSQAETRYVTLFVTDANGCRNNVQQPVTITQPNVYIQAIDNNSMYACSTLTKKFALVASEELASFTWNFGDGTTSTEAEPEHTYSTGSYTVTLKYTTAKGCAGVSNSLYNISVYQKPKADFSSLSGTTICGNTVTQFQRKTDYTSPYDYWLVNGAFAMVNSNNSRFDYQFTDTGKYTITLIAYNNGCSDTMTRTDYITVLPSFPKISGAKNTCDGDRGTITFSQASHYAQTWTWDFGDGTTATYNTDEPEITHHYTKTGQYNVSLTTTNGQCSNKDFTTVYVLLKQSPVLSASKTNFCVEELLHYTITNLSFNDLGNIPNNYYYVQSYQFNDGTTVPTDYYYDYWFTSVPYNSIFRNLEKGKDQIRVEIRENYFNCLDTTNFIPIKISGATAGFEILTNNVCFKLPVSFKDTSHAENTAIISRQWDFGDGQTQTTTQGGIVSHTYANPGAYYVMLKVTDASGCTSTTTSSYTQMAYVNGPKAAFSVSEVNAHLNATIHFYNNTNNYNSYNTQYEWQFGDGSSSNEYYPSYTYTKPGNYKIRLIAKNPGTGCTDTAYQEITVKNFNANFSFTSSFINSIECSPTLVQFRNTSYDYSHIKWDFGDGATSDNINYPSHVYTKPGKYIIKLFVTGYNGLSHTYTDSVIIKNSKVNITADILHGCTSQSVTLSAITGDAASYLWDFGDGTIVQATDTFSVHQYKRPGIYIPKLITKDGQGCAASVTLADKIIIDSLYLSLNSLPEKICTPKEITFNPLVLNSASGQSQLPLVYHWDFGTGNVEDSSNIKTPSFIYQQTGTYTVSLKVQSPYGCVKQATASILALQGLGGKITGPAQICQEASALFAGATTIAGQPKWKWVFDDGSIVEQQDPPARKYDNPGNYMIKLIVDNKGCADTVSHILQVYEKPVVSLSQKEATICEGAGIAITAGGGASYSWSPAVGLSNTSTASVFASPLSNTAYEVVVTNAFGCTNTGSVNIKVIHPFQLQLPQAVSICKGQSLQINASGAVAYQWIEHTNNLSNVHIANPVATPLNTVTYTVKGTGENQCFTDTARINIIVNETPVADAGPGAEILLGTAYHLQPQQGNDIVKWDWSPSQYLNCNNCPTPVATPLEAITYTLRVTNSKGCMASDTVSLKLFCNESRIYIPNAFTPNNDGLNDLFSIKGQGISKVKRLRIFDRWGSLVFERADFRVDDQRAAWDGKLKGQPVPMGIYIYYAEMSCNERSFTQKGTVTVLY